MSWQTTWPTVATVMNADHQTLETWDENLPKPKTDAERAVRKLVDKRLWSKVSDVCREQEPEFVEKWNALMDRVEKLTGASGRRL